MLTFISLMLVHVIADFYLQPHSWIMDKVKYKEKSIGLLKHIGVHTLLTLCALLLTQSVNLTILYALAFIILTHYAIDVWKTHMGFTTKFFLMDQIGHIVVLAAVSFYLSDVSNKIVLDGINTFINAQFVALVIIYLLSYKPLSILIQLLLRPYLQQFDNEKNENHGLEKAGEYIGGLERFLIITFVLLDQFAGIGFMLAAKSVFRFGDMRRQQDRKLTEYIMLGTLLSFTFALLLGLGLKHIFT